LASEDFVPNLARPAKREDRLEVEADEALVLSIRRIANPLDPGAGELTFRRMADG